MPAEGFEHFGNEAAGLGLDWPPFEDETAAGLRLPYRIYGNLTSVVRETVSNAIRHARATTLTVLPSVEAGRLILTIADDGVGIGKSTPGTSTGLGLGSLSRRIESIGGRVSLPEVEAGTVVRLEIPLPAAVIPFAAGPAAGRPPPTRAAAE